MTSPQILAITTVITPVTALMLVVCLSFLICVAIGMGEETVSDFLSGGRSLSGLRNGLTLFGTHLTVTALLIPVGTVALGGYDGMVFALNTVAALAVVLLLAEPLRKSGALTLGGILEQRIAGPAVRVAASTVTLLVCVPLIIVQLKVAGDATAYLLGMDSVDTARVCTLMIGLLIISFAAFGGMKGTSFIELGKALLCLVAFAAAALLVLARFDWNIGSLMDAAAQGSGRNDAYRTPNYLYGDKAYGSWERVSVSLALVLGSGVLPPILMRIGASRSSRSARRSSCHAIIAFSLFSATMIILGLGAAALAGGRAIVMDDAQGTSALFLLTREIAGGRNGFFATVLACTVFITTLGAVAALTLAAAASLSHNLHARTRHHQASAEQEVRVTRLLLMTLGVLSVALATGLHNWSILFFASWAATVAASAILPALLYTFFWQGLTRRGLLWTLYGSAASCCLLQFFNPTVSGSPLALFPEQDFAWFPLENTAAVTVPLGFLLGWAVSRLDAPTKPRNHPVETPQTHNPGSPPTPTPTGHGRR
ncbi:sodium:solute symporter family transporter [Streptomyces microflavus]|uniref:sodium:solute symporter family transporter n=1 Tax=Streptomyces microflavus TaxID=1919 RepID=UPI0036AF2665